MSWDEVSARTQLGRRIILRVTPERPHLRGLDSRGRVVASGTYFVRLTAAGQILQEKMTLLK